MTPEGMRVLGPVLCFGSADDTIRAITDPTGEIARDRCAAPPSALNRRGVVRLMPIPLLVRDMYGLPPLGAVQRLAPGAKLMRVELTEHGGWLCVEFPGLKPVEAFDANDPATMRAMLAEQARGDWSR